MNRLLLLITAFFTMFTASAYTSADARKVLDKAVAKVSTKSGATAHFTLTGGKVGQQSGTVSVKGNKFTARTGNAIMWYDGKTQWVYTKRNEEVNVSYPSAGQQQSMNPYAFLTLYKKGYTLSMTNSGSNYQVHLSGKGKSISEMYILIDKKHTIKQVRLKQRNGWLTINISNFHATPLPDSAFRFNAKDYPQAEVIDLR